MIRIGVAFVVLLALSGLTFGLSFASLGPLEVPVAMGIAAIKVVVLGYGFMKLAERTASQRLVFLVMLSLVGTLIALTVLDTASR